MKLGYLLLACLADRGRSPQGERGLKRIIGQYVVSDDGSLPARGAWVETQALAQGRAGAVSLPARGAWVETVPASTVNSTAGVAPRKGSVG